MPKINREEYEILKGLDDKWKWIARDNKGYGTKLKAHTSRPDKMIDSHWSNGDMTLQLLGGEHLFQFIQWEDETPYNIAELIKEYESEETEVKNIEWLKSWFKNEKVHYQGKYINSKINQLDEPEVLSQELPVIPKFVAEWIEKYIEYGYDLYPPLKKMENNARSWERTYDWYRNNTLEFVLAYLTQEYEIEEEQKYRVIDRHKVYLLAKEEERNKVETVAKLVEFYGHEDVELNYHLTEQEIKSYDPRYMTFAVKVEELEE